MQRLLPISPGDHRLGRDLVWCAEALHRAGCRQLLVREPQLDRRELVELLNALASRIPVLIVHHRCVDAVELALAGGWGLHGPPELLTAWASRIRAPCGSSTHGVQEVRAAAAAGADYVLLSPIHRPISKPDDARRPLGRARLASACRGAATKVFALGGMTPERVAEARAAGAYGVASLGWLWGDPADAEGLYARARRLLEAAERPPPGPGG